jgi:nitric oxide reductase activation protein
MIIRLFFYVLSLYLFVNQFIIIKKVELLPPFLPQIYHKLNLLILW